MVLDGLEWAWQPAETNLRCAGSPRIFMANTNILVPIVFEIYLDRLD